MSSEHVWEEDYKGKFDPQIWRRILRLARPYRKQLYGLGASGLLLAIIDTLIPILTSRLIDVASKEGLTTSLYTYGGLYALFLTTIALCVWVFIMLAGQTATGVAFDIRQSGFQRLQELSFSYYDTRSTGWLVSRLTSDCSKISSLIPWFLLDLVWGLCLVTGIVIAMLWLQWQLALVVLTIIPMLFATSVYFQYKLLDSARSIRKTNSQITANFNESVMGMRTTKALVRETENLKEFQVLSADIFQSSMKNALQSAVYLPLITTIGSVGVGLALWFGGSHVLLGRTGDLTLGQLIAFMQYATLLYMPIQEMARRFTELQSAQAAAERVQDLLDTEPAIQDSEEVQSAIAKATQAQKEGLADDGKPHSIQNITFNNISFSYKANEPVLQNFQLEVNVGQTIALVGATGSGKSTIVNVLARFYEPTSGTILINGEDYRKRSLHWLQSQLGVMLQTPHLFRGSVRENIRYGRLDATDQEIEEAARMVNAHDFIHQLEEGYQTDVGEAGGNLSTGQRQLIALARAVVADPQIVIMDEATSSIDTETEKLIQKAVETVLSGRISFVIAHRLSTVRSADKILVIDRGQILEQGTHQQLMNQRGKYYSLYTKQFIQHSQTHLLTASPSL